MSPGEADVQVAGEGGAPAFLEDEALECLHRAIRLRATGADQRLASAALGERRAEVVGAELAAVIPA